MKYITLADEAEAAIHALRIFNTARIRTTFSTDKDGGWFIVYRLCKEQARRLRDDVDWLSITDGELW
jgi:hypothetical protein